MYTIITDTTYFKPLSDIVYRSALYKNNIELDLCMDMAVLGISLEVIHRFRNKLFLNTTCRVNIFALAIIY